MRRHLLSIVAAALAGAVLPVPGAVADGGLGGFVATATATPIRVEIYEPTIPIPADPQVELNLAYTRTEGVTGPSGQGRASWLWPGDSVGTGFKTIVEFAGLPSQLGDNGYPVQVNAQSHGEPENQADEPLPGVVMRTSADDSEVVAKAAFSSSGELSDGDSSSGDGRSQTPLPGEPGGLLAGAGLVAQDPSPSPSSGTPTDDPQTAPGLGQLAALVDAGGVTSLSRSTYGGDTVVATGITRITDVSLLGGLVTADSVSSLARTTSTLGKVVSASQLRISGLAIAGNPFTVTKDGVDAAGHPAPIPGLPDDPAKALAQLGISFVLPTSTRTADHNQGSQTVRGLQVVVDTTVLRSRLDTGPLENLLAQLPDQMAQLKSLLGAALHASPRVVVTLGSARSEAGVVPPVAPGGSTPSSGGSSGDVPSTGTSAGGGSSVGGLPAAGQAGVPAADLPTPSTSSTPSTLAAQAAGLPPLGSVPGMLLVGGLALASALGWWLQKVGILVLGRGAACTLGLQTGLPDLRKA